MNAAVYPLYSKAEIDSKFLFSPGTSNTSFIWRESMYSSWTNDIPTPFNAYLELSPSSTCSDEFFFVKSMTESL